jgi:glutamate-1-semialdehyde 2,1-aminomutase
MNGARSTRYRRSAELLERAERLIPTGTQTFSKSCLQFPRGSAPHFLVRGRGGRVWDVDGNEYVDLVAGLLPVMLGHCDPDVDDAIRAQLERGITLSLATELELALAERLVELIPCAEMVRFGKNGTDATSAAVRVARAATRRERIIACGYHGWADWYVGATVRHKGVPGCVRALTHRVPYNDLGALERTLDEHPREFAALIMEPMHAEEPTPGYLQGVRDLAHAHGALLVFDEIITGFRFALGGAQAVFGVTPDLACFGKAMGNGMPISVVAGRADLMRQYEDVFVSGTFGGEALSLAAAVAVIDKMRREPVIEALWRTGEQLGAGARKRIRCHGLEEVLGLAGKPPFLSLSFRGHADASPEAIRTLFAHSMLEQGVLIIASHNVMYAHNEGDLEHVLAAYDHTLGRIARELERPGLAERLGGELIRPVFGVRD